jgi:lysophospholipase L1-like esterase
MATPFWPSSLPHEPVLGSWQIEALNLAPLATDMEGGNTRQRRRPGSNVMTINQTLSMTIEQLTTFKAFVRNALKEGTSRFRMPVWLGDGCFEKVCQFAAQPTVVAAGTKRFFASMQLRVYEDIIPVEPADFGSVYAWWWMHNNSYMTVNHDGTGGLPGNNGTIGRVTDRGPNAKHLSQVTAPNRPIFRTGLAANFRYPIGEAGLDRSSLRNIDMVINSRNFSGGAIYDLSGAYQSPLIVLDIEPPANLFDIFAGQGSGAPGGQYLGYFAGGGALPTAVPHRGRKYVMTWRSNSSNLIIRALGSEFSTTALANQTLTFFLLASFGGGNPKPMRCYECVIYNEDIGADNIQRLEDHLQGIAGAPDPTRTVVVYGDSMSMGCGSILNKPWHDIGYITNRSGHTWYNFAADGGYLNPPHVSAADVAALKGSNEGLVVLWIGTNDIINNRPPATLEAELAAYCGTLKAAGCKVIVCTLQAMIHAINPDLNVDVPAFNALVKANYTGYADAIVKLDEASQLSDPTNSTYYVVDQVHLKDAGHAVVASLINAAMVSLPIS